MSFHVLESRDQRAATGILAAAALATAPNVAGDEPEIAKAYRTEAQELLKEIRKHLRIDRDDHSPPAILSIANLLTKQIEETILGHADTSQILARAGQAGRLPPVMYTVDQPKSFSNLFYNLGVRRNHVEDAVKHPDDYQHLMTEKATEESKDVISLFVKEIKSAKTGSNNWLLVQCHRQGLTQIVQSAWRIFPDTIDLTQAYEPLHLLKAFVAVFGLPVSVAGKETLFIESVPYPKGPLLDWRFQAVGPDVFASISQVATTDPTMIEVGIGYSINLPKYREYLAQHGVP